MGLDISKIQNAALKELAQKKDLNGDSKLNAEEFAIFKAEAEELGVSEEDFTQAMGLYKEAQSTGLTSNKKRAIQVLDSLTEFVKKEGLGKDLMDKVKTEYPNPDYAPEIQTVEAFYKAVTAEKPQTKDDIKKLEKIRDSLVERANGNEVVSKQAKLMSEIIKVAKNDIIAKETKEILDYYEEVKTGHNTKDKKAVAEHFADKVKTSYYKDAMKRFEKALKSNALAQLYEDLAETTGETRRAVKKEVKAAHAEEFGENDKIYNKVAKKQKEVEKGVARGNKFDRTMEDLKTISASDLENALGKDLLAKLDKSFLAKHKNADGTYDVSEISEKMLMTVGYDYLMNRSDDTKVSEFFHAQKALEELFGVNDLTKDEVKKLMKLTSIKMEPKERQIVKWGNIVRDMIASGVSGATGAALSSAVINVSQEATQHVGLELQAGVAKDILEQLKQAGMQEGKDFTSSTLANGKIAINIDQHLLQNVHIDRRIFDILEGAVAGLGIGLITSLAFDTLFGEGQKYEKSCISLTDLDKTDPAYTNFNEYSKWAKTKYPEQADGLIILASLFSDENGKLDGDGLYQYLRLVAGKGSHINCLEGRLARIRAPKPQPAVTEPPKQEAVQQTVKQDVIATAQEVHVNYSEEAVPQYNARLSDWNTLVALYPCFGKDGVFKDISQNDKIRVLKLAQGITDGNYSTERMQDLLAHKSDFKYLAKLEGFDLNVYKNQLAATAFKDDANIKLPKQLADCVRVEIVEQNGDHGRAFLATKTKYSSNGNVVLNQGSKADTTKKEHRSTTYYVKYRENGQLKTEEFSDMAKRDARVAQLRQNPNVSDIVKEYKEDKSGFDNDQLDPIEVKE